MFVMRQTKIFFLFFTFIFIVDASNKVLERYEKQLNALSKKMNNGKPVIVKGMLKRYKCIEEYVALDENGNVIETKDSKPVVSYAEDITKNEEHYPDFSLGKISKVKTTSEPFFTTSESVPPVTQSTTTTQQQLKHMPSIEVDPTTVDLFYDESRESDAYVAPYRHSASERDNYRSKLRNHDAHNSPHFNNNPNFTRDSDDYQYVDYEVAYLNRLNRFRKQRLFRPNYYHEFPDYESPYNRRDSYRSDFRRQHPLGRMLTGGYSNYYGQRTVTLPPSKEPLPVVDKTLPMPSTTPEPYIVSSRLPIKTIQKQHSLKHPLTLPVSATPVFSKAFEQENEPEQNTLVPAPAPPITKAFLKKHLQMTPENCAKAKNFAKTFFVPDPRKWIRQNCNLAQMFVQGVTCEELTKFVDSCYLRHFL